MSNIPDWVSIPKGTENYFILDPDIFYPHFFKLLGVEKPDQYWIEIAQGCMKLAFDQWVRMSGLLTPGKAVNRVIRSDGGRKRRWNHTMLPPGKKDLNKLGAAARGREIALHWRRLTGAV